jgi:N-acetylmuramoyl-L-alanine amidase
MAQDLADALRGKGYEVLLTRTDDTFIPLEERARLANKYSADLFVSLHCNASLSSKLRGFEVYFLSESASDPHAAAVARLENAPLALEGKSGPTPSQVEAVLRSLVKTAYINESSALGALVERHLSDRLSEPSLGVKQAAFYVLRGAEMPAVLIEAGFLTNRKDERLLQKDAFRRRLVDGVSRGVEAFDKRKQKERV